MKILSLLFIAVVSVTIAPTLFAQNPLISHDQRWNLPQPAGSNNDLTLKPYHLPAGENEPKQAALPEQARCDNPVNIQCGVPLLNQNNNTGITSQFNYIDYKMGCIGSAQTNGWTGPERLYRFTLNEQSSVHVIMDIKTAGVDLDVFLLRETCQPFNCYAFSLETVSHEMVDVNLTAGTYYILVDGFFPTSIATFDLSLNCTCTCIEPPTDLPSGKVLYCDNFQDYKNNLSIDQQSTRWNGFAGVNSDDAVTEQAGSNLYARFRNAGAFNPDMNYYLDEKETGRYRVSWRMRVENNRAAYFAMMHERSSYSPAPAGNVWAYEADFNINGTGILRPGTANGSNDVPFVYPQATWFNVVNIVDLNKDSVELWVNNTFVSKWRFSLAYDAINNVQLANLKRLAAVNFYASSQTDFAIDDICVWTTKTPCSGTSGDAVCTGSNSRYANEGLARCDLFTTLEFDDCLNVCDYGGTFVYRGDRFNGFLDNSDLAAGFIKNDPCVRSAYGNNMPAQLYADIYIFYKNDNNDFNVNLGNTNNGQIKKFVFSCRSNPNCSVQKQTCLTEVSTGYAPASCNNTYYIVVTGPVGSSYNLQIFPEGSCGSVFDNISCGTPVLNAATNNNSTFSKAGGAYNACYGGNRNYTGGERIYRFYVGIPQRTILTLEPTVPSSKMGMFLYSYLCGQQCFTYAENSSSGGKAVISEPLVAGTYYLVVDSDAGNPQFKLNLDCQSVTNVYITDVDTCTTCGCLAKAPLPPDPITVINSYCSCKGTNKDNPHNVEIRAPGTPFSDSDQIWFLYNNENTEITSHGQYQKNWKPVVANGEPNVSFQLGSDNPNDAPRKCSYTNNDDLQIYLTQFINGQQHYRRLLPTFATGAGINSTNGKFINSGNSVINRLSLIGDPIFFTGPPPQNPPPTAGSRPIEIGSNGPWTMIKQPAPGFANADWLTVTTPTGAGTGAGVDRLSLSYPANPSAYSRAALLIFTYTRQPTFKMVVRVQQQGICVLANIIEIATSPTATICNSGTATLTPNVGTYNTESLQNLYNYNWSTGETTASITRTAMIGINNTYTVSITNKYTTCPNGDTETKTISVGTAPTAQIGGGNSVCNGSPVQLTASGAGAGGTYLWSTNSTNQQISFVPVLGANTYTVTATNAAGCTGTAMTTVPILMLPVANISSDPAGVICAGQPVILTASGGGTYRWSQGNATTTAINVNPAAGSNTYTVTVTAGNGCTVTATRQINAGTTPGVTIISPTAVCPNTPANLSAAGPAGASYQWNTGAVTPSINPTVSALTTYTVTVTQGSCTGTATATVDVRVLPVLTMKQTTATCGLPAGTAMVTVTAGTGPFQYNWSNGGNNNTISGVAAGNYQVTVRDANNCTVINNVTVGNSNGPTAAASADKTNVCNGTSIALSAATTGGMMPYTYLWSNGATASALSVTPLSSGPYAVTIRDANGCTSAAQVNITVNQPPTPGIVGNNAVCPNASISLSGTGGNIYQWSTGVTGPSITISLAQPVVIRLTATDANGCTASVSKEIGIHPVPVPVIAGNTAICFGASTTLIASGGSSYNWNTGSGNQEISVSPLTNTTYTVTVVNGAGCSAVTATAITVRLPPNAAITGNTTICSGATVALAASGGGTYSWNTGQTNGSITVNPAATTTYTVTVTSNGCSSTDTHTITANPLPVAVISGNTTVCSGFGTVLNASGGTQYLWSNGTTSPALPVSPLATTTYTVTITNDQNCSAVANVTVNVRPMATVSIAKTDAACNQSVGSAVATISGGTAPFTYFWSNGLISSTINGLSPGFYAVTATDNNGCTATAVTTIGNANGPAATITGGQALCAGSSATLIVEVNSGKSPYQYLWSNGNTSSTFGVSPAITTLYTVTVRDANGCTGTAQAAVSINTPPTPNITGNTSVCAGSSANLTVVGGQTFVWSNGETTESIAVPLITTTTFTVTATNTLGCTATALRTVQANALPVVAINGNTTVCPGSTSLLTANGGLLYAWSNGFSTPTIPIVPTGTTTYTVTVTNELNCSATASTVVTLRSAAMITVAKTDASCNLPVGSAAVAVTGTGPFTYFWSNGSTTNSISNLAAGAYGLTVLDGNGCSSSTNVTIGNANGPSANAGANQTSCAGKSLNLTAVASGGVLPYSYSWNNGSTTAVTSVNPATTTTYTVVIRDANGCTSAAQVQVAVNLPPTPTISGSGSVCAGAEITLTAVGGIQYAWNTGSTSTTLDVSPTATTTFTVTATNGNGCSATATRTVTVNALPMAEISGPAAVCTGQNITLAVTGGSSFTWSTGATASNIQISPSTTTTYLVSVTNAAGCTATVAKIVKVNQLPIPVVTASNAACGQSNGSAVTTVMGGATPYRYIWNNSFSTATITGLAAGAYTVTVTDLNGCSNVSNATVANTNGPTAGAGANSAVCTGGSVILNAFANGGTPPYSYHWSTGSMSDAIALMPTVTATYTVTVSDVNNCTSTSSVTVTVNPLPPVIITGNTSLCNGQVTRLTASGGQSYLWNTGSSAATISVTTAGLYVVTATGANGCMATHSLQMTLQPGVTASLNVIAPVRCFGQSTGALSVTPLGGTPPFTVLWSNGAVQPQIGALPAGTYTVIVSDQSNCKDTAAVTLTTPPMLALPNTVIRDDLNNAAQGSIEVFPTGGVSPYLYVWSGDNFLLAGQTQMLLDSIPAGRYGVRVTDANGCPLNGGPYIVNNIVATHEPEWAKQLTIYPNPTTGQLFLQLTETAWITVQQLTVTDVLGRAIWSQSNFGLSATPQEIDISSAASGAYLIKLQLNDAIVVRKIWVMARE